MSSLYFLGLQWSSVSCQNHRNRHHKSDGGNINSKTPLFDSESAQDVTTTLGHTAFLHCRVRYLGDRRVNFSLSSFHFSFSDFSIWNITHFLWFLTSHIEYIIIISFGFFLYETEILRFKLNYYGRMWLLKQRRRILF